MITIGRYNFDGPYSSTSKLEDRAGVYAIIDARTGENILVDVGESAVVRTRVENHDRSDCWNRNTIGKLQAAVLYTPNLHQEGRMRIEQEIRNQFHPACGVR